MKKQKNIEWIGDKYPDVKWRCKICGKTGDNLNFGATISNIEEHFKTHEREAKFNSIHEDTQGLIDKSLLLD